MKYQRNDETRLLPPRSYIDRLLEEAEKRNDNYTAGLCVAAREGDERSADELWDRYLEDCG